MLIRAEEINKTYGTGRGTRKVLDHASLDVQEGESIAILGPSGSGKTTLLNILGSLDSPDSGSVFFRNDNITLFSESKLNFFRNRNIGFIFQLHHLLPQLTLLENVLLPTLVIDDRTDRAKRQDYATSLMKRIGVWDQRDQKPGQLSGGECQRTAVIRAMINSPSVLLADEPTGALDSRNAENLADLLIELNRTENLALIIVTHSRHLASRMQSIYELDNGRLMKTISN